MPSNIFNYFIGHIYKPYSFCRGFKASEISIRAGSNYYYKGGQSRKVKKLIIHPNYNQSTMENDIALMKLDRPFSLSKNVGIVDLATKLPAGGKKVSVSGYGTTSTGGDVADYLMVAIVKYIDYTTCKKRFGSVLKQNIMICAGIKGKDSCQGDSGGPMTFNGQLIGVVSWGYDCADPKYPGVYVSVPKFRKWIIQNSVEPIASTRTSNTTPCSPFK